MRQLQLWGAVLFVVLLLSAGCTGLEVCNLCTFTSYYPLSRARRTTIMRFLLLSWFFHAVFCFFVGIFWVVFPGFFPLGIPKVQRNVNLIDLVKRFPTSIYLQTSASIQPRTSLSKFGNDSTHFFICLRSHHHLSDGVSCSDLSPRQQSCQIQNLSLRHHKSILVGTKPSIMASLITAKLVRCVFQPRRVFS